MKTIYLIRHAKSDWNTGVRDFERPLNKRGLRDVPFMGNKLLELDIDIENIFSSPANRAKITALGISKQINYNDNSISFIDSIYHSSVENLVGIINNFNNSLNAVAIVGHNPGLTYLSNYLTNDYIDNIVTCGIVKIELEIDNWNEIIEGIGRKVFYIYPKMYN